MDFCASSESNKWKANRALIIYPYSKGSENRLVVVQHIGEEKTVRLYEGFPQNESKFFDQDIDVVFPANKGIDLVIGCFVGRNYNCKEKTSDPDNSSE